MKKISAIFVAIAILFSFGACVKEEKTNYDAEAVADALNSGLSFGEALEKSTADAAYSIYGIDPALCTNAAIYVGSGATADEVAVFNCVDSDAAKSVLEAVNSRVEYLKEGYSSYGPDQVPKIDSAAIVTLDNNVILCICDNPENVNGIILGVK